MPYILAFFRLAEMEMKIKHNLIDQERKKQEHPYSFDVYRRSGGRAIVDFVWIEFYERAAF